MTERLVAEWMSRADLAALNAALGQGMARYVGGAVRDGLLGLPVKDIDMATLLQPRETMRRLKEAAITAIPTDFLKGRSLFTNLGKTTPAPK